MRGAVLEYKSGDKETISLLPYLVSGPQQHFINVQFMRGQLFPFFLPYAVSGTNPLPQNRTACVCQRCKLSQQVVVTCGN